MSKDEILAALAVMALTGAIIYVFNTSQTNAANAASITTTQAMSADLESNDYNEDAFNVGPADYVANTPYLFQVPLGNIVPALTAPNTGTLSQATVNGITSNQMLSSCVGCGGSNA